jgi:hypothetical protein
MNDPGVLACATGATVSPAVTPAAAVVAITRAICLITRILMFFTSR